MRKIYSIISILSILLVGCSDDFLDKKSLTTIEDNTFWTSESDALLALAGCYSTLQGNFLFDSDRGQGGVVRWDYMSDDGWVRWKWMSGGAVARGEHSTNDWICGSFWREAYEGIARCNRVIETVPQLGENIIEENTSKQIVAEAKFIRALLYNMLTMTYRDVPLITKIQSIEEANVPKDSKETIVEFITTDLENCVEDLSLKGDVDWGRVTRGAGYALLARINLYNENWADAASWSQKVIDLNYSLYPDFHALFQAENEINDEVIFPVRFRRGPEEQGSSFMGFWGYGVKYYEEVLPNLGEDYFCVDGKPVTESTLYNAEVPSQNRDPRFSASIVSNGDLWRGEPINTYSKTLTGYAQRKYAEEGNDENHFDAEEDFYVFRLGEVLLMRAEALAELGAPSSDVFALINQLRDRSSVMMPHVNQTEVDNYFGGSIIDMVRHERRIETAFEGLRYIDIRRWGIQKERAVDFYMAHEKANNKKLSARKWKPEHVVWPIPQSEIDKNSALVQHAEWQ